MRENFKILAAGIVGGVVGGILGGLMISFGPAVFLKTSLRLPNTASSASMPVKSMKSMDL